MDNIVAHLDARAANQRSINANFRIDLLAVFFCEAIDQ